MPVEPEPHTANKAGQLASLFQCGLALGLLGAFLNGESSVTVRSITHPGVDEFTRAGDLQAEAGPPSLGCCE